MKGWKLKNYHKNILKKKTEKELKKRIGKIDIEKISWIFYNFEIFEKIWEIIFGRKKIWKTIESKKIEKKYFSKIGK